MSGFRLFDLNPEQETAVRTTEGPVLILAGAGTGKTRVIIARVAYLLAQGVDPGHVLAVTFTNKAAEEMRERLEGIVEKSQAKKVTMSTFHALCVRILRIDIERLGYKKNFSIFDEGDQMGLIKKIITRTAAKDEKLDPKRDGQIFVYLNKPVIGLWPNLLRNASEGKGKIWVYRIPK